VSELTNKNRLRVTQLKEVAEAEAKVTGKGNGILT